MQDRLIAGGRKFLQLLKSPTRQPQEAERPICRTSISCQLISAVRPVPSALKQASLPENRKYAVCSLIVPFGTSLFASTTVIGAPLS